MKKKIVESMAAVMLFLQQTTGKTKRHTHFCMPLEPVFTRDCGGRVHFTDEPTGNLDQKNSREIMDMLKLSNRNLEQTILLITHDENIALEADRIVTIEDGQIISDEKRG
ncbi:macrolide export ATP-binding/permease protein MacB [Lachnospiraceae bacterium]|nr:macrolide export ATP-binding/permease protein MacB [Lachnospiraceae bacterium]